MCRPPGILAKLIGGRHGGACLHLLSAVSTTVVQSRPKSWACQLHPRQAARWPRGTRLDRRCPPTSARRRPKKSSAASFRIVREEVWFDDEAIPPLQSFDGSKLVDDDEYSDADADKTDNSEIDVDETVDSLEEALKSHDTISLPHVESTFPRPSSRRDNPSAQSLIATHKSIMSKLLQMLQVRVRMPCSYTIFTCSNATPP